MPREVLDRLDPPRFKRDPRANQHEDLQIGYDFDILDDQDLMHLRSSQDEALPPHELPRRAHFPVSLRPAAPIGAQGVPWARE